MKGQTSIFFVEADRSLETCIVKVSSACGNVTFAKVEAVLLIFISYLTLNAVQVINMLQKYFLNGLLSEVTYVLNSFWWDPIYNFKAETLHRENARNNITACVVSHLL